MDAHLHFHPIDTNSLNQAVRDNVAQALREDIGDGDISADLIGPTTQAKAQVITRQPGIFCGTLWVDEILKQIDTSVNINWQVDDGDSLVAEQVLFELQGNARSLLSAERNMLNFVQFLSGTATRTAAYAALLAGTNTQLLDTRKTVPGLRLAQKYAVKCGGGSNHRIGLFDAFLLKENHISAAGGIRQAVLAAQRNHSGKPVEVEVEDLRELGEALDAGADIALIDNFSLTDTATAVELSRGKMLLEASGGIDRETIVAIAKTGVDFISCGDLTKEVMPLDLSMRFLLD